MLKELLATLFLATSFGTPKITRSSPSKAYVGSTYVCTGAYTFQDEFDFTAIYDALGGVTSHTLTIGTINRNDITMFGKPTGDDYATWDLQEMEIYIDDDHTARIDFDSRNDFNWQVFDIVDSNDIAYVEYTGDFEYLTTNFVMTFNEEYYLTGVDAIIFNTLFNKSGNRYVQYYNGYYHYNNGNWFSNTYAPTYYDFGALFMTQGYIFNSYSYDTSKVSYNTMYKNGTTQSYVVAYDNGNYTNLSNITIQGLLPVRVRQCLNSTGQFQFVNDTPNTSWYEMILATMDAPIYYLKNLLGFELFGMNLFIAFASLMTLMLIIAIIKKVV